MRSDTTYGHSVEHSETGAWLRLRNGTTISIQWGMYEVAIKEWALRDKAMVEVAAWAKPGLPSLRVPGFIENDDEYVTGYLSGGQVAAFISAVAAVDEAKENTNHE